MIVRNFEYLLALSKEKHFARAAASCSVSQPTLSAGIKQLEEDMDVLIVRRGQRFEGFTPEGERVLAWAQQMLDDCMRLKQELHTLRDNGMQGPFRIGMLPATMSLASLLSVQFAETAPGLQISIATSDAAGLLQSLRQGEMDVALSYIDDDTAEGFTTHTLYRERIFLFSKNKQDAATRIPWAEIAAQPLCLLRNAIPAGAAAQLKQAAKLIETDSAEVLAAHVATGRWSTVLPQSLAGILHASGPLYARPISKPAEQANVGFVVLKSDPLPAAVHALMELAHTSQMVTSIRRMLKSHEPYLLKTAR